jgi:hypothetical protein
MWTLRNMHIHRDSLTILTVTELVESDALAQFEEFLHAQIKFNAELEKHSEKLIAEHLRRAREAKVRHHDALAKRRPVARREGAFACALFEAGKIFERIEQSIFLARLAMSIWVVNARRYQSFSRAR